MDKGSPSRRLVDLCNQRTRSAGCVLGTLRLRGLQGPFSRPALGISQSDHDCSKNHAETHDLAWDNRLVGVSWGRVGEAREATEGYPSSVSTGRR